MNKVERRRSLAALLGSALLVGSAATGMAQQATAAKTEVAKAEAPVPAGPVVAPKGDSIDQIKKPTDWFSWGADFRLRQEYMHNPYLMSSDPPGHDWNVNRYRARVWDTITPMQNLDINTRLTWEGRYWWTPESKETPAWSDVLFDNMNARLKMTEVNSTLTLGRQDIILGDGWLVLDGTPLDGSRTIYFDAARLSVDIKECKSTADLIFVKQFSDPDVWLSPIASKSVPQMEQDETAAIVYLTNKSLANTQIDGYFIYKHDDAVLTNGDNSDIYTFGGRAVYDFNKNWQIKSESAYQFGDRKNVVLFPNSDGDLSAWGSTNRLSYFFRDEWKNQLRVGYEYLSGDDPDSATNEQFDPLWGRWPQFSELWAYNAAVETRPGEAANMHRVNVGWSADPIKNMGVSLDYYALFADENTHASRPGFSNSGNFRGHMVTALMKYKFNRFLSGHLLGEYLFPGDYYKEMEGTPFDTRKDAACFLRAEIVFTF